MKRFSDTVSQLGIKKGDIFVAAALLFLSASAGIIIALSKPAPEYVSVRLNGSEVYRLPLDRDTTLAVTQSNTIQISGGKVRMLSADCPDKVCVNSGAISHSGDTIVCAPNKVVLVIIGGRKSSVDAHAY